MQLSSRIILASVVGLCALPTAACSSDDSCEGTSSCASGATGGTSGNAGSAGNAGSSAAGGAGGSSGDGGSCDDTKSPSEEGCLVSDEFAVFVSPNGNAGATGAQTDPLNSITEAATAASASGKIVVVCNGSFDEHVKITTGAKIYGGFDCSTWAYQSGTHASVEPSTEGYAVEVSAGDASIVIEDMAFKSQNATGAGGSSIAAFVKQSTNVRLSRLRFEAGSGVTGDNGSLTEFVFPTAMDLQANDANAAVGGLAKPYTCPDGTQTIGAAGGNGGISATGGGTGQPDLGAGQGGSGTDCGSGATGKKGADAPPATNGPGATTSGAVSSTGWTAASATPGTAGSPGQGGGGGAGMPVAQGGGGGGGGGAGACGGAGGGAGQTGGSSIALLSFESTIQIREGEFVTASAGDGGDGVAGQAGQSLGGFAGGGKLGGCAGGAGGKGGNGGSGGGGAGGASAGVVHSGAAPDVDAATTFQLGSAGAKGDGGTPGVNDGVAGAKENVLQAQ